MNDYKLKVLLTILSAVVFSLIFILLAFVIPINNAPMTFESKQAPKSKLEKISRSMKGEE